MIAAPLTRSEETHASICFSSAGQEWWGLGLRWEDDGMDDVMATGSISSAHRAVRRSSSR